LYKIQISNENYRKNRIFFHSVKLYSEILDSTHRITFKWRGGKGDLFEVTH